MDISTTQIIIALLAAMMIGFSKTGVPSVGIFVVAIMASIFPARESVGIVLPMLITADLVAVSYYRRTVIWPYLFKLIPWVLVGLLVGFYILGKIDNQGLSVMIGVLVVSLIVLHLSRDKLESKLQYRFTQAPVFHGFLGILAGFATMIGNAAGGIMAIYLLSKGMKKNEFIGTGAYFFLAVNLIKVPFTVYLGLITPQSLLFNAWMIPAILFGTFVGIKILPMIPQKYFQYLILALAALGGLRLIFQ